MLPALGAASSAIDALQALTSLEITVREIRRGQPAEPVRLLSGSTASAGSKRPVGSGGSQISPETMSALLAAQSQASTRHPRQPAVRTR